MAWSAAASMVARTSAGTRSSRCAWRARPRSVSILAIASSTLPSMPVAARAWNASGTRPGGASASCGLRPDALEAPSESRAGARMTRARMPAAVASSAAGDREVGWWVGVHERCSRYGGECYVVGVEVVTVLISGSGQGDWAYWVRAPSAMVGRITTAPGATSRSDAGTARACTAREGGPGSIRGKGPRRAVMTAGERTTARPVGESTCASRAAALRFDRRTKEDARPMSPVRRFDHVG